MRICSEVVGVAAYGFINRGFNTVVRPALGGSLLDTDCVSCGLCIGTCPTGAIAEKLPLAKPGPWPTASVADRLPLLRRRLPAQLRGLRRHAGQGLAARGRPGHLRQPLPEGALRLRATSRPRDRLAAGRDPRRPRAAGDAASTTPSATPRMRLKELTRRYTRRRDRGLRLAAPDQRGDLPGAEARARGPGHAQRDLASPSLVNRELRLPRGRLDGHLRGPRGRAGDPGRQLRTWTRSTSSSTCWPRRRSARAASSIYVGPEANRTSRFAEVFLQLRGRRPGPRRSSALLPRTCADGAAGAWTNLPQLARGAGGVTPSGSRSRPGSTAADLARGGRAILAGSILKVLVFNKDYRGPRRRRRRAALRGGGGGAGLPAARPAREVEHAGAARHGRAARAGCPGYVADRRRGGRRRSSRRSGASSLRDLEGRDGDVADAAAPEEDQGRGGPRRGPAREPEPAAATWARGCWRPTSSWWATSS